MVATQRDGMLLRANAVDGTVKGTVTRHHIMPQSGVTLTGEKLGDVFCTRYGTDFCWRAATISAWRAPGCAARHENARCRGRVEVPGHARCMWTYGVYVTVCAGCAATHAWRNSTKWHGRLLRLQHGSQPRGHVHVRCCAGAWVDRQRDIFRCDDGVTDQR